MPTWQPANTLTCALTPNSYSDPSRQTTEKLLHARSLSSLEKNEQITDDKTVKEWQGTSFTTAPIANYSVYLNHLKESESSDSGKDGVSKPKTATTFC